MRVESKNMMTKQEFEQKKEDFYAIYQLKAKEDLADLLFVDLDSIRKKGHKVEFDNYEMVYAAPWNEQLSLEKLYVLFNVDYPNDYKARSLSVSDIIVIKRGGIIEAYYVDDVGYQCVTLEFWQPQQYAVAVRDRFLSIQELDAYSGYDYSIYDSDYVLLDGGIYDDYSVTIDEAWNVIYDDFLKDDRICGAVSIFSTAKQIDYDMLQEKVSKAELVKRGEIAPIDGVEKFKDRTDLFFHKIHGHDQKELEENVWFYLLSKVNSCELGVKISEIAICGNRSRGQEKKMDADLDVAVEYSGDFAEDTLFNILNEDGFSISGIHVDLNPIREDKSGTLEEYLFRQESYYSELDKYMEDEKRLPYYEEKFPLSLIENSLKEKGYDIERKKVEKSSGTYEGIIFLNGSDIAPIVYMEAVLNSCSKKDWSLEELVDGFINVNKEAILQVMYVGIRKFKEDSLVKRDVSEFPGIEEYMYLYICNDTGKEIVMNIRKEFLEKCGILEEYAWEIARNNTFSETEIRNLYATPMLIVTNHRAFRGAATILNKVFLRRIANRLNVHKFIAFPSSINEFLLMPCYDDMEVDMEEMNEMVRSVNRNCVAEEEQLGDGVYVIEV